MTVPAVRLLPGVVTSIDPPVVNVDGSTPTAAWVGTYIPLVGDVVRVLLVDGQAMVLGPVAESERPLTGTVSGAAGTGFVPVSTTAGTLQCRYTGTAPATSTVVRLDWQSTVPWVWAGAVATTLATTTAPTAPAAPRTVTTGTLPVAAIDSGRWSTAYGWGSTYPTRLQQGTSGGTNTGAWFYGNAPSAIVGRSVTACRVWVRRSLIHGSGSASPVHLYLHTSRTRPAGNVTMTSGPTDVSLPRGGSAWVNLPASWGQAIVDSGGGIAIHGDPYLMVDGIADTPASGQLEFDWTA